MSSGGSPQDDQGLVSTLLGGGSEDSATVQSNVGSLSFPAMLHKTPSSTAISQMPFFLNSKASCNVALNSGRRCDTRDIATLNMKLVFPISQQCYFLGFTLYSTFKNDIAYSLNQQQ